MGYPEGVTGLLEEALRRIEALAPEDQDRIASEILETLDDEASWIRTFQERQEEFRKAAGEALAEHRRGETQPLENLLGE